MSRTGVEAAIEKLRESVSGAVDVLVEVMNDSEASPADRTRAATAILDRVREIGTHVHQHVDTALPDADIERELTAIAERARERALVG
jgi:nicotinate-nucleotide pyrophosphorylase